MALSHPLKGKSLLSRLKPFLELERFQGSFIDDGGRTQFSSNTGSGEVEFSNWRKLDSRRLGVKKSMITLSSWSVLNNLRVAGFDAYLVGGCVRDLLLNRVPKDFDVITTATLQQVKKKFQRAAIVGKRFPICRVIVKGSLVEVSSFDTLDKKSRRKQVDSSQMPMGCDPRDFVRWTNCMNRDFTVNSLFFDPFLNVIFDYTNGMMDLKFSKLRTVIPAQSSFLEDQARILRGLRLAARLSLSFSKETEAAIYSLSSLIADLSTSRISLEMNYMLSYGAAASSFILLKRFKLLEILLPFQAAYLSKQVDNRLDVHSLMLMKLFFNLDQLVTCDRPCSPSMWVAIMAFHMALFSNPQHAAVVLTFASLLYHQTWEESIKFARRSVLDIWNYAPEILDASHSLSDDEIAERVTQFAGQVEHSVDVLINKDCLLEAMNRFPEIPCSGLVFVSQRLGQQVKDIINVPTKDITSLKPDKRIADVDYRLLTHGNRGQVRFVLGKIILQTLSYRPIVTKAKKDITQVKNSPELEVLEQIHRPIVTEAKKDITQVKNSPEELEVLEQIHRPIVTKAKKVITQVKNSPEELEVLEQIHRPIVTKAKKDITQVKNSPELEVLEQIHRPIVTKAKKDITQVKNSPEELEVLEQIHRPFVTKAKKDITQVKNSPELEVLEQIHRPIVTKAKKVITQVKNSPEELEVLEQIRTGHIDSMVKNANKRSISPSNNDPSSPQNSRKLGHDEFDLHSYSLVLDKISKDTHVKVEKNRKVPLLSSLF